MPIVVLKHVGPSTGVKASGLLNAVSSWLMSPGRKDTTLSVWQDSIAVSPVSNVCVWKRS